MPSTMLRVAAPLLAALIASDLAAQLVGWRDESFPNTSGSGTPLLACRVFYPATQLGANTPFKAPAGKYPVVVHLHGAGGDGRATPEMSMAIASVGFVVVMQDTARSSSSTQYADAMALVPALQVENQSPTSFYQGRLDLTRMGLEGHSMGGGNTLRVLAASSAFRAGICFAPTAATSQASVIKFPMLIVVGMGDTVVNWQNGALADYNALASYTGLKELYLFNTECNHATMIATPLNSVELAIFTRTMRLVTGFWRAWLYDESAALEEVAGPPARNEPRLVQLSIACERPLTLKVPYPGLPTARVYTFAEPGPGWLLLALGRGKLTTNHGTLLLDPGTLTAIPAMIGTDRLFAFDLPLLPPGLETPWRISVQALAQTRYGVARLGNVEDL